MATRTISNAGGNYNNIATWVEGIAPTSADDVVATATSGQLTVSTGSAARSVNFTNYVNTLTMNALLTVSGASIANVFVSSMTITGTSEIFFSGASQTITTNGKIIPNLVMSGSKTLLDEMNIVNHRIAGAVTITGTNNVNISGNFNITAPYTSLTATHSMIGTGTLTTIGNSYTGILTISSSGTITLTPSGLLLGTLAAVSNSTFKYISGTIAGTKLLRLQPPQAGGGTITLDTNIIQWDTINILDGLVSGAIFDTFNLSSDLKFNRLNFYSNHQSGPNTNTTWFVFSGSGRLIGGTVYIGNITAYSGIIGQYIEYGPSELRFTPGPTHSVDDFAWSGLPTWQARIRSTVPGTKANLAMTLSRLPSMWTNFTDIDSSLGNVFYCLQGTASNCTNIIYNTSIQNIVGGGVSGGSFTFVN